MQEPLKRSPTWQYVLWACLLTSPAWGVAIVAMLPRTDRAEAMSDEVFVTRGVLRNGTGNPYLVKADGSSYSLVCPPIKGDRKRRACFVDSWWELNGSKVVVTHRKPYKRILSEVVVCNITDSAGRSILRPAWVNNCR